MTAADERALLLLRSQSGLSIDDEGRFLHHGEPVTHARTLATLWSSLAPTSDGRWEIAIGRERAFVDVGETPWHVRGVVVDEGDAPPTLLLSDGTAEPLDPATLSVGADGVLRCVLERGAKARFTRAGQVALGRVIDEDPPGSGCYALTVRGTRWPIRADAP